MQNSLLTPGRVSAQAKKSCWAGWLVQEEDLKLIDNYKAYLDEILTTEELHINFFLSA
jgi:hypothetical protein